MLRSAATAGARLADAKTNANAAVLAHSVLFIPDLDATHPALEDRNRRAPARGLSDGDDGQQIFGTCGADATGTHSRRFFSQSSRYLWAMARSPSLAWASALVYMSVIHVSSGPAASFATMSQNNPSAAWRETSSPLNSMPPSSACAL